MFHVEEKEEILPSFSLASYGLKVKLSQVEVINLVFYRHTGKLTN